MLNCCPATAKDISEIKALLDTLDLSEEHQTFDHFWLARNPETNTLIGVVRFEEYPEFFFLASLGIDPNLQKRGYGLEFLRQLFNVPAIKQSCKPIFLRTIIPEFFKKAGFQSLVEIKVLTQILPPKKKAECRFCDPKKCTLMIKLPDAA